MGRGSGCIPAEGTTIPGIGVEISGKAIVALLTLSALVAIAGVIMTSVGFAQSGNSPVEHYSGKQNFYTRHMVGESNGLTVAGPILIIVGVLFTILFGALWMMNWETSKRIFEDRHYNYQPHDMEELKRMRPAPEAHETYEKEPRNGSGSRQTDEFSDDSTPDQEDPKKDNPRKSTGV
ncbi:unnamed protein product [Notodromas monacha]|uniref:Uncharacterized protein n=1 Tax=Notodromas monacha TaxID=399045 RepID=A0A7R9BEF3_9CRUS|nr:unnamed protein product [Notodromas monacha]CAG0913815.1 unnamed protein product [Notodromas monacha]